MPVQRCVPVRVSTAVAPALYRMRQKSRAPPGRFVTAKGKSQPNCLGVDQKCVPDPVKTGEENSREAKPPADARCGCKKTPDAAFAGTVDQQDQDTGKGQEHHRPEKAENGASASVETTPAAKAINARRHAPCERIIGWVSLDSFTVRPRCVVDRGAWPVAVCSSIAVACSSAPRGIEVSRTMDSSDLLDPARISIQESRFPKLSSPPTRVGRAPTAGVRSLVAT